MQTLGKDQLTGVMLFNRKKGKEQTQAVLHVHQHSSSSQNPFVRTVLMADSTNINLYTDRYVFYIAVPAFSKPQPF